MARKQYPDEDHVILKLAEHAIDKFGAGPFAECMGDVCSTRAEECRERNPQNKIRRRQWQRAAEWLYKTARKVEV